MSLSKPRLQEPATQGLNIFPFATMAGGWIGPLIIFWLYVWGPLRPFRYPTGKLLPDISFLPIIMACLSLWWVLPRSYFRICSFERTGRFYENLGVRMFRRFAPDGEFANRWERRKCPQYRLIRDRRSAYDFLLRTEQSERGHVVLLSIGVVSASFAWRLGWFGWAVYLSFGNLLVNLYPIMLQRYTRGRIFTLLERRSHL
jgi:hypothetical protein